LPPGIEIGLVPKEKRPKPENYTISADSRFVNCLSIYARSRVLKAYLSRYSVLGIASSAIKAGGLGDMLTDEDYNDECVHFFIVVDIFLQKAINDQKK
jgi:hypothetical protein